MLSPELPEKTYVVAYNKMELLEAYENWLLFKEKQHAHGIKTFCMSAVKREGTHEVIRAAHKLLQESKEANKGFEGSEVASSAIFHSGQIMVAAYFIPLMACRLLQIAT